MYLETITKATSVKEIGIIKYPENGEPGIADFMFRPVFSAFDYGTIHPPVPLDNSTIVLMGGFNFEKIQGLQAIPPGITSHYISLVHEGQEISAREAKKEGIYPTTMRVKFVHRVMPEFKDGTWNYDNFENAPEPHVQPVEFITRNSLPPASSVWRRIEAGDVSLQDLGLPADHDPRFDFPPGTAPLLDYSTKFEPNDRYIKAEEARQIMHIDQHTFAHLQEVMRTTSNFFTNYAESRGFQRHDGKVEFAGTMLVDAVCTWHEDRLTWKGFPISKQVIRNEVIKYNPRWVAEIKRAKHQAKDEGHPDFRTLMDPDIEYTSPPAEFFTAVNNLFRAATDQWVGAYTGAPGDTRVDKAIADLKEVQK